MTQRERCAISRELSLHAVKVAACQLPDVRNDCDRSLSLVKEFASRAAETGCRLVCFPECFVQGYFVDQPSVQRVAIDLNGPEFAAIVEQLRGCVPVLVLGLIERSGGRFFNTAIAVYAGEVLCRYRKMRLLEGERQVYREGTGPSVFTVDRSRVGIAICNDLNFPQTVEATAAAGAEIIACPSNNMMELEVADRWKQRHSEIRRRRAREAGVWLLSSDVTGTRDSAISYGPTSVIDPSGVVVAEVPSMHTGLAVYDIPARLL